MPGPFASAENARDTIVQWKPSAPLRILLQSMNRAGKEQRFPALPQQGFRPSEPLDKAMKKVLMVLTSHDRFGNTGRDTGFWLEEFAAPYYLFKDA